MSHPNIVGLSYKGYVGGTFLNSYDDQTVFFGRAHNILTAGRFGVDFLYALAYGYHGKLTTSDNMPEFLKPLFEGEINPIAALVPYYRISDRLEVLGMVTPLFLSVGIKVNTSNKVEHKAPPKRSPNLIFSLGGGIGAQPAYFGADSVTVGPRFSFSLEYLRLSKKRTMGSTDPDYVATGFAPRASFRLISARSATDHAELAGLEDVDASLELGMGLVYRQPHYEVFADARYGVLGHKSFVGELGLDLIARPNKKLKLSIGPRLSLGDNHFASTYFGVTPAESVASGMAAHSASGGLLSAGIEFNSRYALNDKWSLNGTIRYDRLLNDAAASPITKQGSADQFSVQFLVEHRFRTAVYR